MRSKYAVFLSDKDVRRWYENVARGSPITASTYLRRLGAFCNGKGMKPADLVRMKDRHIYNMLLDTASDMEAKKCTGGYISCVLKAVKSWLNFNGREVKGQIKVRGLGDTPTLRDERVPTQTELRSIFLAGDEKARAVCVLLAHSGVRPEVLGNYDGSDGLSVGDLPEMELYGNEVSFNRMPAMVRVRASLSKKRHEYFTFLGEEGCQYLKAYMEMRLRRGEKLTAGSSIIRPKTAKKRFITTVNIGDAARNAIRKAGFPWRPYVLRSYFNTQLMLAESKGLIIHDYRSFFMGHKGDIEAVYSVNKRRLPPDVVEQMRESYAKAQKYLQTAQTSGEEDLRKAFKRQLLLVAGYKADEIKDEQLELSDDDFQRLARDRLTAEVKNNGARQKVVNSSEVEHHLREGWEFVAALPDNKAVLKLPELR